MSYIIWPNPFRTPARTAWSRIFATACFNQARRTCQRHKNTFTPGHTHCNPPISTYAQSVMNALGIQSFCTDTIFFASALIHGSRSVCLELEVIMYATGTPFSQSSKTIKVYNGNCNNISQEITLEYTLNHAGYKKHTYNVHSGIACIAHVA